MQGSVNTSNISIGLQTTISAIFGIEGDNPPEPDPTYWRKGYTFAVQLTNWALAMAPHHPVADAYLRQLRSTVTQNRELRGVDPVNVTGPPAFTAAVMGTVAERGDGFSWDALSSLGDPNGGRGKTIAGKSCR